MKNIIKHILITLLLIIPINVFAKGYLDVSPSIINVELGGSKTIRITAVNTSGSVRLSSSNNEIASLNSEYWVTGEVSQNETKIGLINVLGKSLGKCTITVTADATTLSGERLTGQIREVEINVVPKPKPSPSPSPSPSPNPPTNNNNNDNKPANNTPAPTKSTNNKIKEIKIDNYKVIKVDDNKYTLTVGNKVDKVNISGVAEDSKAKVSGEGEQKLEIGVNTFNLVVTSEAGEQNKIEIVITRKDGYYLEDLDEILNSSDSSNMEIIINEDTVISSQNINKIKDSGKEVKFSYYDKNNKLIYSWIFNGARIESVNKVNTGIDFNSNNESDIKSKFKDADGMFISLRQKETIPEGTRLRIYVGNKYDDDKVVNVYYYNPTSKEVELVESGIEIYEGFVEFLGDKGSDYFITEGKSNSTKKEAPVVEEKDNTKYIIAGIAIAVLVVLSIIFFSLMKKSNKKETK